VRDAEHFAIVQMFRPKTIFQAALEEDVDEAIVLTLSIE